MALWSVLAFLTFLCGHWTARLAERRGRSRASWFVIGLLFAPLALVVARMLPIRPAEGAVHS